MISRLSSKTSGLWLAAAGAIVLAGCAGSRGAAWFQRPRTSRDYLNMALDSQRADDRREGIIGLARSRDGATEWAVKVYDTVARTDTDPSVRCAALRALLRNLDARSVATGLKILRSADGPVEGIRPAPARVRWGAARLLHAAVDADAYREEQEEEIIQTLLQRVPKEEDVNVRLALIETMGCLPDRRVLPVLIDALERENFAEQHAAELALVALTGVSHQHYAEAWRKWLSETPDPFEHMGEIPAEMQAKKSKPRWDWLEWWE
ncbi:MAG: HEAT repeat domain-containing protein [Phycisphaerae bacterium]